MRIVLTALLGLLLATSAGAGLRDVETTATGYGASESEALGDALARAVTQVQGGNASLSTGVTRAQLDAIRQSPWGTHSLSANYEERRSADFQGGGPIARYQVLTTRQLAPERFEVKVSAVIHQYEAPSRGAQRDRIAVLPVRGEAALLQVAGQVDAAELADALGRALEAQLLATGNFQVLDRATLGISVEELALVASPLTGAPDKARLQQLRGADYLLVPTLIRRGDAGGRNPATGQRHARPGDLKLDLRVLVPATSEVVYSGQTPIHAPHASDRDAVVGGIASQAIAALDRSISGSTRLPPAATGTAGETPRDSAGVRLPFDR